MGDSTMKTNNIYTYPQAGWGQPLNLMVKNGVSVENHAENGRSTKSFIDEGRFDAILKRIQKGDYVICSFGHNDEKIQDPKRYTSPFDTYQKNLKYFSDEILKRGGNIVFATSITRHKFENGTCINSHGDYPKAMIEFAKENNFTCIDMNKLTMDYYNLIGEEESAKLHMIFKPKTYEYYDEGKDDHSHLNFNGAVTIAKIFVRALKKTDSKLKECFLDLDIREEIDWKMLVD